MNELINFYSFYFNDFVAIAIVHLLAVISPGPDFIIIIKQSNSKGRKAAIITSFGIALSAGK